MKYRSTPIVMMLLMAISSHTTCFGASLPVIHEDEAADAPSGKGKGGDVWKAGKHWSSHDDFCGRQPIRDDTVYVLNASQQHIKVTMSTTGERVNVRTQANRQQHANTTSTAASSADQASNADRSRSSIMNFKQQAAETGGSVDAYGGMTGGGCKVAGYRHTNDVSSQQQHNSRATQNSMAQQRSNASYQNGSADEATFHHEEGTMYENPTEMRIIHPGRPARLSFGESSFGRVTVYYKDGDVVSENMLAGRSRRGCVFVVRDIGTGELECEDISSQQLPQEVSQLDQRDQRDQERDQRDQERDQRDQERDQRDQERDAELMMLRTEKDTLRTELTELQQAIANDDDARHTEQQRLDALRAHAVTRSNHERRSGSNALHIVYLKGLADGLSQLSTVILP